VYRFPNSYGYDGQFYLIIAHDPWMNRGYGKYIDLPGLRYGRIAVPALANTVSHATFLSVNAAYIAVTLVFLFAGTWWTSTLLARRGRSPFWGACFVLLPASLVSLDRLTVDLAFMALLMGVLFLWEAGSHWEMAVLLSLLCLVRETGLLVGGAFLLFFLTSSQWSRVSLVVLSVVPWLLWAQYVHRHYPFVLKVWIPEAPFADTFRAVVHGPTYTFAPVINVLIRGLDLLALAAMGSAIVYSLAKLQSALRAPINATLVLFAFLGIYLFSLDGWTHVYDFGRVLCPIPAILLLNGLTSKTPLLLAPTALMTLRVVAQLGPQILGIFRL